MNLSLCLVPRQPEALASDLPEGPRSEKLREVLELVGIFLEQQGAVSRPPFSRAEHIKVFPTDPEAARVLTGIPGVRKVTVSFVVGKDCFDLDLITPDSTPIKTPLLVDLGVELDPEFKQEFVEGLSVFTGVEFIPAFLVY